MNSKVNAVLRKIRGLDLMGLSSDMREAYWGFLQSGLSDLDFDFRKYGKDHLGRFLSQAQSPGFLRLLATVRGR